MIVRMLAAMSLAGSLIAAPVRAESEAELYQFLDAVYERDLRAKPMLAASLGVKRDTDRWDGVSSAALAQEATRVHADLETLRGRFDPEALDARARFHYLVLEDELELRLERYKWRRHHYPLNQIVGLHLQVPGTLTKLHPVETREDAEAYIARIEAVGPLFDGFVARMKARNEAGFYGPQTVYPLLINGARSVIKGRPFEADSGEDNPVWSDFQEKIAALDLRRRDERALLRRAERALLQDFGPAYENLIAALEAEQEASPVDGGVWQLPDGDAYYEFLVRQFTTTDLTPAEIHELGLKEVERIHGEMRKIKKAVGFEGDLKAFFEYFRTDPKFYLPNTDEGRAEYMRKAEAALDLMKANITQAFYGLPPIGVHIRRIEPYRESASPAAFYEAGSADGARPGTIFLRLDDMSNAAVYDLEALLYHEGIPGHHMQISSILTDANMPELRKLSVWYSNSAYVEGWALYAEALAKELGGYQDPYSDFGRLAAELWRACRLVVDSGLHYKQWTRREAIDYLNENTPGAENANIRAVERYLAVPGQAVSFKVGMIRIQEKREEAHSRLGDAFDLRGFHQAVLENGYVPLWAMEYWVDRWIERMQEEG